MIAREGVARLTHRTVAAEAGVPPAAPGYYFASVDEIVVAALRRACDRYVAEVDALAAAVEGGADLATALADLVVDGTVDSRLLRAEYELYLLAARRAELRPTALRWAERLEAVIGDGDGTPAIVALVEGASVQAMLGRPPSRAAMRAAITRLTDR